MPIITIMCSNLWAHLPTLVNIHLHVKPTMITWIVILDIIYKSRYIKILLNKIRIYYKENITKRIRSITNKNVDKQT